MKIQKYTYMFIGIMIVSITIYDVYAIFVGGTQATISWAMIDWAYKYPLFPFIMGLLSGHLFWRMPGYDKKLKGKHD